MVIALCLVGMLACCIVGGWAFRGARDNGDLERLGEATSTLRNDFQKALEPAVLRLAVVAERVAARATRRRG